MRIKKKALEQSLANNMGNTHDALQTLWDNINKGQQKQLIKIKEIKDILDRYKVNYEANK